MKRIGYLITPEKITIDFCKSVIRRAAVGKMKRTAVKRVINNIDKYAEALRDMVLNKTYRPSSYNIHNTVDRPSGKRRVLHKPRFFPDQCVHHVLIGLVQDRLTKRLDPYAIASIPGRGIHYGYRAITKWLNGDRKGTKWCLKCDIKKCYENIKPKYIVESFKKFVKDKSYLWILATVAFSMNSLPLGNYTSAWFENLLLLDMDTAIRQNEAANYYLRYVDDFIVLSANKRKLRRILEIIVDMLARIGLRSKENWQIFSVAVRGIDMLGYRFFYGYVLLRKRCLLGLFRAVNKFVKKPCRYFAVRLSCRLGGLEWFNSFNLKEKIMSKINIYKLKQLCRTQKIYGGLAMA